MRKVQKKKLKNLIFCSQDVDRQRVSGIGQGDEAVLLPLAAGQGVRVARPAQRQRRRRLRLYPELPSRGQARI